MAEKINIAEFNIDVESLTAAAAETVRAIEQIRKEQSAMRKEGKQTDEAFVQNAVVLRGLQKDYNAQLKVLENYMSATGRQLPLQQQIDAALRREATSIEELRKQNSELTKARNQANITTKEGQAQIAAINAQLDKNNDLIKEQVSDLEQQKMGIGGYADGIKEALGGTTLFGGAINDVNSALKQFDPVVNLLKTDLGQATESLRNAAAGTEGMTVAQKAAAIASNVFSGSLKLLRVALISTGIGAIVVALGSLVAYLSSSEEASNRFSRILKTISGVVRGLIRQLEPLGELLFDGIEAGFNAIGKAADAALKLVGNALDSLGFDNAAKSVRNFHEEMGEAADMARLLAEREEQYTVSQRNANRIMLDYQRQAERLRQVRDDESLSMDERNQANEDLGKVLQEQLATEKQIAIQALEIANLRIAADGRSADNLDAQAEAMERISDIQERVEGQMSEQLTNRNSLQRDSISLAKEAADEAQKRAADEATRMQDEIALLEAQQGFRAKTLEETIAFDQEIADKRLAILQHELDNKLISQTEYNTAALELQNELGEQQANAVVEAAQRELNNLEDRLDIEAKISRAVGDERIALEIEQSKRLAEARAQFELERFEQGLINETEYQDSLDAIRKERNEKDIEANAEREALALKRREEAAELNLESELLALEERNASIWEIEEAQILAGRERDLEAARQRYTDEALLAQAILNINTEAENAISELTRVRMRERYQAKAEFLGAMASIFGQETAVGKAAGIAQATINAYVGMTEALKLPWPLNLAAAASTLATGLSAVRSITSTKTDIKNPSIPSYNDSNGQTDLNTTLNAIPPFATGGLVTGGLPIRRSNGDNVLATLKRGEVVLNNQQQMALGGPSIFRYIGVPGFASGGIAGGNTATLQRSIMPGFNEQIAKSIGEAVRQGALLGTETGAHRGILDLSTERYLNDLSTF